MRTLDIGGDKAFLIFRSKRKTLFGVARYSCLHPEIFLTQIRAMLRANSVFGNLRILLPMITTLEELRASKRSSNASFGINR